MKIMYVPCGEDTNIRDPCSYEHYWTSSWNRAWKNWVQIKWFIWAQHNDQFPVGLLAQLVERCIGIAKVMGSNPVRAWIFFRSYFNY